MILIWVFSFCFINVLLAIGKFLASDAWVEEHKSTFWRGNTKCFCKSSHCNRSIYLCIVTFWGHEICFWDQNGNERKLLFLRADKLQFRGRIAINCWRGQKPLSLLSCFWKNSRKVSIKDKRSCCTAPGVSRFSHSFLYQIPWFLFSCEACNILCKGWLICSQFE